MTTGRLLVSLCVSLGLTLLLELVFVLALGVRAKKDLLLVCAVNVVTNPPVVLLYALCAAFAFRPLLVAVLEAAAVLAEAYYYRRYGGMKRPFLFSLSANVFSFGVGAILNVLFR